eukprot:gene1477-12597_t
MLKQCSSNAQGLMNNAQAMLKQCSRTHENQTDF